MTLLWLLNGGELLSQGLSVVNDIDWAFNSETFPVAFEALNFMKGFCCQIAFATVRTAYDRNIFDDEHISPLAISPVDMSNPCPFFAADVTYCCIFHKAYTAIKTTLPVGLSFARISAASPSTVCPAIRYFL